MRPVPRVPLSRTRRRSRLHAALLAVALIAVLPATAQAVERIETPIVSQSYETDVSASLVRLHIPLPATAVAHPEACDWIQYVRYRSVDGPTRSMDANSVVILNPGILEGAMAFDVLARNSVREAARRGRHIEVWAIDRRSNCLEDLTGLNKYEETGDLSDVLDYYWHGKPIDGKVFEGFDRNNKVLLSIGLEQTSRDLYDLMVNELPSQPWRESHVICGGHSIGGPLLQVFAGWDFDGNRKTTTDAGYRQCAGFVGFETFMDLDPTQDSALLRTAINVLTLGQSQIVRTAGADALKNGLLDARVPLGGADPRSAVVLEAAGIGASRDPNSDATPLLRGVPYETSMDDYYHFSGSANLNKLITTKDSIRKYRYTSMGLLGQLLDDNGSVFSASRASFGFFDGAPLRRNILGAQVGLIPVINMAFQSNQMFLPAYPSKNTPLMGWKNYDQVGRPGEPGYGSTTPETEVTNATDMARILHEGPTNFGEPYFPMRVILELTSFYGGDHGGSLSGFTYRHPFTRKPRMASLGGSGVQLKAHFGSVDPYVVNPGYEHVDSITAAERQNSGKPEGSTKVVVDMIDKVVAK